MHEEDVVHTIDLCSRCVNEEVETRYFQHGPHHHLAKMQHTLLTGSKHVKSYVKTARQVVERAKSLIPVKEADPNGPSCCSCLKPVTLPCWMCITCGKDGYLSCVRTTPHASMLADEDVCICDECEADELPCKVDGLKHNTGHDILRCPAPSTAKHILTTDERIEVINDKLQDSQAQLTTKIAAFQQEMDNRLMALEMKVDVRLGVLEELLRSFVASAQRA